MSELLTVKEAAALLKTSRVQVRKMIQAGDLLAVKVGREYRISMTSLRAFVEGSMTQMDFIGGKCL